MSVAVLGDLTFGRPKHEARRVRAYMEWQARDEKVIYLERVGSETLLGRELGCWDVHTDKAKWWVITNPTNLYRQDLFPSLDYTLSFHVGVTTRMYARDPEHEGHARVERLMPTLKRLEAAGHALDEAHEAEDFQAIGMKLRECLLALLRGLFRSAYAPAGQEPLKASDFINRMELVANAVAGGQSAEFTRGYLKDTAKRTWQMVNWLTHTTSATLQDAKIAHGAVEAVVSAFLQAAEKHEAGTPDQCPSCGSYRVTEHYRPDLGIDPPYIKLCERCD